MAALENCRSCGLSKCGLFKENVVDVPADFFKSWQLWEASKATGEAHFCIAEDYLNLFNYEELEAATRKYCRSPFFLGKGPYGNLFRCILMLKYGDAPPAATSVVIEQLDPLSTRVDETLRDEVEYMYRHMSYNSHLLNLIGYAYREPFNALLVYEPIPGDTLADHLSGISLKSNIDWGLRIRIAYNVATALRFLHGLDPPLIWRDASTATVFIDKWLHPRIFNIGVSTNNASRSNSPRSTLKLLHPLGLGSAAAPEYYETGSITTSCNVYSFGVFLLQIVSGRKIVDESRPVKERIIVDWARPLLSEGKILDIMDPRIQVKWQFEDTATTLCGLAQQCIRRNPERRPSMYSICTVLKTLAFGGYIEISPNPEIFSDYFDKMVHNFLERLSPTGVC